MRFLIFILGGRTVLMVFGIAAVFLFAGCESEKAKWSLARAEILRQEGQLNEAKKQGKKALEKAPENRQIKLWLASLLSETGQGELGIKLCDEYLEQYPTDPKAHTVRTTCLQYLGRFDEALADYKRMISGHVYKEPNELNNLAYFRALARENLSRAANEIQEAIKTNDMELGSDWYMPMRIRTVVCAALVSRHIDQRDQALEFLDRTIGQLETGLEQWEMEEMGLGLWLGSNDFRLLKPDEAEMAKARVEFGRRNLAMLLASRALVNEDRQAFVCVDADRARLIELGFEFDEVIGKLPSDRVCLLSLNMARVFLDTRGFVFGRLDWGSDHVRGSTRRDPNELTRVRGGYLKALEDMDLAILAATFKQRALESSLYNSNEISPDLIKIKKEIAHGYTAVLLFHRMEIHRRGGNEAAANADEKRIEGMGYPPGSNLF